MTENFENEDTWLNGRFPLFDVYKAENEEYGVRGSPSLVINGKSVSAGRDSASLLSAICSGFETAPEECETSLSATSPAPGFGYEGSGSATTATCG